MKRHPAITPSSYPQVQAPIVNNPAFWERLGLEPFGTDTLFFAFYYQQVPELTMLLTILCPFQKKKLCCSVMCTYIDFYVEHIPTIFGCKGAQEAVLEIPPKV
jgi:hypothetical protein